MHFSLLNLFALTAFYASIANGCMPNKPNKQNWNNLKLPFHIFPLFGFHDQPRTVPDAEEAGWTKVDVSVDCKQVNNGR